jgi:hypothetical protein|tara:strand:+ start:563 stop:1003 length:441 start_codon:yes stop_codon:yes gene_type:complete
MAHIRKTIRENIGTALTGLSTTGSSVFESRTFPINFSTLPALLIYTKDEEVVEFSLKTPRTQFRQLQVIIEAHIKGTSNIDDTIDTIAEEVEEAMVTDVSRGGHAKDTRLVSTEIEFEEATSKVGLAIFTYVIEYATVENAVQTGV